MGKPRVGKHHLHDKIVQGKSVHPEGWDRPGVSIIVIMLLSASKGLLAVTLDAAIF